jgi:hypothetical protein
LSRLPPEREVKVSIDILSGTTLVAQALYGMAPAELVDLKVQFKNYYKEGSYTRVIHHIKLQSYMGKGRMGYLGFT